jgi:hypothetical protein
VRTIPRAYKNKPANSLANRSISSLIFHNHTVFPAY